MHDGINGAVVTVCSFGIKGVIEACSGLQIARVKKAIVAGYRMLYEIAVDPGNCSSRRHCQAAGLKGYILNKDCIFRWRLILKDRAGYLLGIGTSHEGYNCQA